MIINYDIYIINYDYTTKYYDKSLCTKFLKNTYMDNIIITFILEFL